MLFTAESIAKGLRLIYTGNDMKTTRENGFRNEIQYISLRQPWAWLVLQGFKDIENRGRVSHFRGELFIHASSSRQYLEEDVEAVREEYGIEVPASELQFGCLIGSVIMVDCVQESKSRGVEGPYGYLVSEPRWIEPIDLKANAGMQKSYDVKIRYLNQK